jgi:serine/threonine protein kinase
VRALEPADPMVIGRYRLLAELGRGGMGRVLLGVDPSGTLVAVKVVRQQYVDDDGFRARFRREVTASRTVVGSHTAAVLDADADAALPWLAAEFVPGLSLQDVVAATGPLPTDALLRLAADLSAALAEVHAAGLVHRDLKPSNVLLTDNGVKVIDFGIARATDSPGGTQLTHTGWLVGSPGFMSPEQADGEPVGPASDVFSLGSVLVMAATGSGPFDGTSTPQTLYRVVHVEPDLAAVPEPIRDIVAACLAKDAAARPTPARLRELVDPPGPPSQPWPDAVHQLIALHRAEVERLPRTADTLPNPLPNPLPSSPTLAAPTVLDEQPGEAPTLHLVDRRKTWIRAGVIAGVVALVAGVTATAIAVAHHGSKHQNAADVQAPPSSDQPTDSQSAPATQPPSSAPPSTSPPSTSPPSTSPPQPSTPPTTQNPPFTSSALLPNQFTDSEGDRFALQAYGPQPCDQAGSGDALQELQSNNCTQLMTGVYIQQPCGATNCNPPLWISVEVFPFADNQTAQQVGAYLWADYHWEQLTKWCSRSGQDNTPCSGRSGFMDMTDTVHGDYLTVATAERTDLTNNGSLKPWYDSAIGQAVALCGPQNYQGS